MQETQVPSLGGEDPLEEDMATHSSLLPWTEEPGRLQSMGSQRVGHNSSDWAHTGSKETRVEQKIFLISRGHWRRAGQRDGQSQEAEPRGAKGEWERAAHALRGEAPGLRTAATHILKTSGWFCSCFLVSLYNCEIHKVKITWWCYTWVKISQRFHHSKNSNFKRREEITSEMSC